jgi:hypothetical protein
MKKILILLIVAALSYTEVSARQPSLVEQYSECCTECDVDYSNISSTYNDCIETKCHPLVVKLSPKEYSSLISRVILTGEAHRRKDTGERTRSLSFKFGNKTGLIAVCSECNTSQLMLISLKKDSTDVVVGIITDFEIDGTPEKYSSFEARVNEQGVIQVSSILQNNADVHMLVEDLWYLWMYEIYQLKIANEWK